MTILALDTSNKTLSVAVELTDGTMIEQTIENTLQHSVLLVPTIEAVFEEAGITAKDLTKVIVAEGPGSYTGLRIGVTVAKTLAKSLGIPLVGISSLDVFLPDLKYMEASTAGRYSAAADYFPRAKEAIRAMARVKGAPVFDTRGVLRSGVLVRHLVLPGRRKESMALLDWLWGEFGDMVLLSLMNQYTPLYRAAEFPEINRRLTTFEYQSVVDHALALGVTRCYVQEGNAASAKFVPAFDGRGVACQSGSDKLQ